MQNNNLDIDPIETQEWLDSLISVVENEGSERAQFLLQQLQKKSEQLGVSFVSQVNTPYINTVSLQQEQQLEIPDDLEISEKITNVLRWNAIAIIKRAGKVTSELGGHIASYASIATLFEIGFNYFFRAPNEKDLGDLVFFQGHSSPGIYARAYLEGRLTEEQLDNFRQEAFKDGLSSYPHPWLMPQFWQFPTVSMGLGPWMGIYQAHFLKYLQNRELLKGDDRKVWVFCGDGEMSEPESLGAITLGGREKLDNLIFVINCNLQRLDGPVWGNGQIIQEFEGVFRGAGWNVIKVIWGSGWDELFAKDKSGLLMRRISELVDGEYQNYSAKDGAYMRQHFFGKYPELLDLVAHLSDEQLKSILKDGGHDTKKVYAAYAMAQAHKGQPTVILAKTVKGYGMGISGEGLNVTHQTKKMKFEVLKIFCQRFNLPLSEEQVSAMSYYKPKPNSVEMQYLQQQRKKLGGYLPARIVQKNSLEIPALEAFAAQLEGTDDREISTTMCFSRILAALLKDENIKKYVVPILADESRTFGLEGLFRQIGIYSSQGQLYQPEDRNQLMYYREDKQGQLLQEGINEAGSVASWIAAATSYATNKLPMIPIYIYYSMFGYQRCGDLIWAAGDMRARGFLMGGTAGRTTLAGEGLQHQDGHNLLMFSFVPNCVSYDPCFSYELAVIVQDGLRRMYQEQEDVFYYITLMNENYVHPPMPAGVEADILKGMYCFQISSCKSKNRVQLLGSGAILREVIAAAKILEVEFDIAADIWSVTSFNELRKNLQATERFNRLHPQEKAQQSHVTFCLHDRKGPVIAATDYIKLFAEQIRGGVEAPYYVLGTDGFGRSDTRSALRKFFEVNANMIAFTALKALADQGEFDAKKLDIAIQQLEIDCDHQDPTTI